MNPRALTVAILVLAVVAVSCISINARVHENGATALSTNTNYLPVVRSNTASILVSQSPPPVDTTESTPLTPSAEATEPAQLTPSAGIPISTPTNSKPPSAGDFFVAPDGTAQGNGSSERPWSLAFALDQPAAVQPGVTIWMRGGTYTGQFTSDLEGTSDKPITMRQYPGERATINGSLYIAKGSTIWWGFEVTNSGIAANTKPINAVSVFGPDTKLINLVIHDNRGSGIGLWREAPGSEIYGCLIYNNGISKFEHGIYVQNETGNHYIRNNILFYQSGYGVHGYVAAGQFIRGLELDGNVAFANGWSSPYASNLLVGGETSASRTRVVNNVTYYASSQLNVDLGYTRTTNEDIAIEHNYFVGGQPVLQVNRWSKASVQNNTLSGEKWYRYIYRHRGQRHHLE